MSKFLEKHFMPREIPALARGITNLNTMQYELSMLTKRKKTTITGRPIKTIETILSVVAEIWGTDPKIILGSSRKQPESKARHVSIMMCREFTQLTDEQIAKVFSKSESIVRKVKAMIAPEHAEHARAACESRLK